MDKMVARREEGSMSANGQGRKAPVLGGFRLGRLAGIDILVHWSWFLIFFLLTWTLAEGLFLNDYPHWAQATAWLAGALTSLLLFGSVLLHEWAHAIMARRQGIDVQSITLFIFGGVSSLAEEPKHPGEEFLIAGVGPATSFVLAGLFGLAGLALRGTAIGTASFYLAFINVLLGAFNLLPGFPLDGGRIFRSIAWARKRSLPEATRLAALTGIGLAFVLMAGGAVAILLGAFLTGIWFVVIGWFLRSQADVALRQVSIRAQLRGLTVSAAMRRDFHPVRPELSLSSLLDDYVLVYNDRCYPVMSNGWLRGLICSADLQKFPRTEWHKRSVSETMTPWERLQVAQASDDLAKAAELMASADVYQLPVMEDSRFVGFVSRSDVMRLIQVRKELSTTGKAEREDREAEAVGYGTKAR
jgi:Zn-dependent protease/CBS domain-containing protein